MNDGNPIKVVENVKVTNYTPAKGRKTSWSDVNITNDKNNNLKLPRNYTSLFDKVKDLDNKPELSWGDALLADSLIGTEGVKNVKTDPKNQVVTFYMSDETIIRIDMGINNKKPIKALQEDIKTGNAEYLNAVEAVWEQLFNDVPLRGAVIKLNHIPSDCKTLGDIRSKYGLPKGCLANNRTKNTGGGSLDNYEATAPITIHVETLANGLGMTKDQIKALFNN